MGRTFTIRTQIARPVAEVFDAIVSRDRLVGYFAGGSSGDLEEGSEITWTWHDTDDCPTAECPVLVKKIVNNELIQLVIDSEKWLKTTDEAYDVIVTMELEALDEDNTMLSISEQGWKDNEEGIKGSYDNCEGWTHMALCLKAYLQHGIDLR